MNTFDERLVRAPRLVDWQGHQIPDWGELAFVPTQVDESSGMRLAEGQRMCVYERVDRSLTHPRFDLWEEPERRHEHRIGSLLSFVDGVLQINNNLHMDDDPEDDYFVPLMLFCPLELQLLLSTPHEIVYPWGLLKASQLQGISG